MAIPYSLSLRSSNPLDETAKKKVYATAQYHEVLSLEKFARHIADHGSCFSRATVQGVLTEAVDCLKEQLLLGNKVQLGEMGAFYVTLRSRGADSADEFNTQSNITNVLPHWERSNKFESLLSDAEFVYVGTREAQAEARKAEKTEIDTELGVISSGDDSTDDTSGSGSVEE